jgi:glycosyl transferase, family 25
LLLPASVCKRVVSASPSIDDSFGAHAAFASSGCRVPPRQAQFPLPVFYINRDCDDDRRANIELALRAAGLAAERVPAIEGLSVPAGLNDFFFDSGTLVSSLTPGEVGCYASHLKACEMITERGLDYALVLEDDALPPRDLRRTIKEVVSQLPNDWDVVHICGAPRRATKPLAELERGRTLVRYSRVPSGAYGYLISAAGARKFLTPIKRYWPFDTDMQRPWLLALQIYGVTPRIVGHDDASPSRIIAMGGRSRGRRGLPKPSRAAWTGNPLHSPAGALYNLQTLGPLWWSRCSVQNACSRIANALRLRQLVQLAAALLSHVRAKFAQRESLLPDDGDAQPERACQTP